LYFRAIADERGLFKVLRFFAGVDLLCAAIVLFAIAGTSFLASEPV